MLVPRVVGKCRLQRVAGPTELLGSRAESVPAVGHADARSDHHSLDHVPAGGEDALVRPDPPLAIREQFFTGFGKFAHQTHA